jgi:hypothetical protein
MCQKVNAPSKILQDMVEISAFKLIEGHLFRDSTIAVLGITRDAVRRGVVGERKVLCHSRAEHGVDSCFRKVGMSNSCLRRCPPSMGASET